MNAQAERLRQIQLKEQAERYEDHSRFGGLKILGFKPDFCIHRQKEMFLKKFESKK